MVEYIPGNLWGEMLPDINNNELLKCCIDTEAYLIDAVLVNVSPSIYDSITTSVTTASFQQYNLFTLPRRPFQDLYHKMVEVIKPCLPSEPHMIQCWLNVFRGGESIGWHSHWSPSYRVVHGFYCVNVTPSFTEYKYETEPDKIYKIESKEGLLVFGKSNDDLHRSSPWVHTEVPRVTIAFDIVPVSTMDISTAPNHYVPF